MNEKFYFILLFIVAFSHDVLDWIEGKIVKNQIVECENMYDEATSDLCRFDSLIDKFTLFT